MDTIEKVKLAMLAIQRYSWEQGVAATALLELGERDLVVQMAAEAVLRQTEDGRLGVVGNATAVTDPCANGEAVHFAWRQTGEERFKTALDRMDDWLLNKAPRRADGTLYHVEDSPQVWVDSYFMAPPYLAAAGYHEEAVKQIEGFRSLLYNPEKKLFSHIWDDSRGGFARKDFWGVGNGWALSGMARVLRFLRVDESKGDGSESTGDGSLLTQTHNESKENRPQLTQKNRPFLTFPLTQVRDKLAGYIREGLDGCLKHMREDGLFHDVLDNKDSFVETNTSQMLAYTIFRGVSEGWLDAAYIQSAEQMRQAAWSKVDGYGYVQGVCGSPAFDRPGTAAEGQAFFLFMEAAARDYYGEGYHHP